MRRSPFLLGITIGFILGSRAGRGPYEQLEAKVRTITNRPDVQDKMGRLKNMADGQVAVVAHKVTPSQPSSEPGAAPSNPVSQSYADPQDLQFSTAAARKGEMVDDLLKQGVSPAEMDQKEDQLRQAGALPEPPAGNKAKPVKDT